MAMLCKDFAEVDTNSTMTEYERQRMEIIRGNQQMLDSLGIRYIPPPQLPDADKDTAVMRRSLRIRDLNSDATIPSQSKDTTSSSHTILPLRHAKTAVSKNKKVPRPTKRVKTHDKKDSHESKRVKTDTENLTPKSSIDFAKCFVPGNEKEVYQPIFERVRELGDETPIGKVNGGWGMDFRDLKMEGKDNINVAPGRIFCLEFLPCADRCVVVSGDRHGNLSIWDADSEEKCVQVFSIHESPILEIVVAPFSFDKVLTCSYDGCIRCMDTEKQLFELLHDNKEGVSAMACALDNHNLIYFGSVYGDLKILDRRTQLLSQNSFHLHDKKINTVDFHPQNQYAFATSSTDTTAKIWDARKLESNQNKSLATIQHSRSVHSANFSPSGMHMATTSYDNTIGFSSGLESLTTTMIYHKNKSRKPISFFKVMWGWDDEYLFVGNMENGLDIISTSTKITSTLHSPFMTEIPARLAKHPLKPGILAGGTVDGQVYIWRK